MRKVKVSDLLQLIYVPRVLLTIRNWPRFLLAYADIGSTPLEEVRLRSGMSVALSGDGPRDAATVAVVFVKKDYGDPPTQATILDIGAHIGCYAVYAAGQASDNRVYALEPSPRNFELLQENVARNGLQSQVFPIGAAVAGGTGTMKLYVRKGTDDSLYKRSSEETPVDVRSLTLQEVILENELSTVDLLKLDVEGAEFEILYATPPDCLRRIRAIRMEYHNLDNVDRNIDSLLRFLRLHGFEIIWRKAHNAVSGLVWMEQKDPTDTAATPTP